MPLQSELLFLTVLLVAQALEEDSGAGGSVAPRLLGPAVLPAAHRAGQAPGPKGAHCPHTGMVDTVCAVYSPRLGT